MTAYEAVVIGSTVTVLTQILKKALPGQGRGIYVAGLVSFLAVVIWVASGADWPPRRTDLWAFFSAWVSVFATAAGLYGISTAPLHPLPPAPAAGDAPAPAAAAAAAPPTPSASGSPPTPPAPGGRLEGRG